MLLRVRVLVLVRVLVRVPVRVWVPVLVSPLGRRRRVPRWCARDRARVRGLGRFAGVVVCVRSADLMRYYDRG